MNLEGGLDMRRGRFEYALRAVCIWFKLLVLHTHILYLYQMVDYGIDGYAGR